ncbi:MAG: segregation/condensation protein A [Planctomycetes bacterium]|nr:segregation/condensation protein A [Planctomycetota bacterium]
MDLLPHKIQLENYCGPLDLLLHLVREDEVEILNIPISRVTRQYIAYLEQMQKMNIDLAGEFLVMAATLMEIKSRTLVPPEVEGEEEEPDPRLELIRKLLEYRRFKDLARGLGQMEAAQALRYGRPARPVAPSTPPEEGPLVVVDLFDLVRAYARMAKETGLDTTASILYSDVPIELLMEEIAKRIALSGRVCFSEVVGDRKDKPRVVGTFLAVLELTRLQRVSVAQARDFGDMELTPATPDPSGPDLDIPGAAIAVRLLAAKAHHPESAGSPAAPGAATPTPPEPVTPITESTPAPQGET